MEWLNRAFSVDEEAGEVVVKTWSTGEYPEEIYAEGRSHKTPKTAVALPGGGTRAFSSCLGVARGLVETKLIDVPRYWTMVSGGNWFGTVFYFLTVVSFSFVSRTKKKIFGFFFSGFFRSRFGTAFVYARHQQDDKKLLGPYVKAELLTLTTLTNSQDGEMTRNPSSLRCRSYFLTVDV